MVPDLLPCLLLLAEACTPHNKRMCAHNTGMMLVQPAVRTSVLCGSGATWLCVVVCGCVCAMYGRVRGEGQGCVEGGVCGR